MPRNRTPFPSYRKHSSGNAIVTLTDPSGQRRDVLLGTYGTPESRSLYDETVSRWVANGRRLDDIASEGVSNSEVLLAYIEANQGRHEKGDRKASSEFEHIKKVAGIVRKLFGTEPAEQFSAKRLKACRTEMIRLGWTRKSVNHHVGRIRRLYKWAVSEELVPSHVLYSLMSVSPLRPGEEGVGESPRVQPVDEGVVNQCLPHMSPPVAAMVRLMLLTGMRAGEALLMRTCDIDREGEVWIYRPFRHKTQKAGRDRLIFLGPAAQTVLTPWLNESGPDGFLFSPRRAVELRNQVRAENRKTPRWSSHMRRNVIKRKAKPKKRPGERYCTQSLGKAINYAIQKADRAERRKIDPNDDRLRVPINERIVPHWHQHQLRHTAATRLRKEFGIELARIVLGHSSAQVTTIYAEQDFKSAIDAMKRLD
jgi:integrase